MKPSEHDFPSALTQAIDQITTKVMAGDLPIPGMVVSLHQQGYAPFNKAYGLADLSVSTPMAVGMPHYIACVTRIFTAVCILKLVEAGKLSLDNTLTTFLPNCAGTASQVTVEQLLCHRSGLPDHELLVQELALDVTKTYSAAERLAIAEQLYTFAKAQPGEEHLYTNFGYLLLALIVEQVTGVSFGEYLHTAIIEPLGLTHTCHIQHPPEGMPAGYAFEDGQSVPPMLQSPSLSPYGAACLISTTGDLLKFYDALRTGKLISPESYASMTAIHSTESLMPGAGYGLGVFISPAEGETVSIGHPGGINGHMAWLTYYPQQHLSLAFTLNVFGMEYLGPLYWMCEAIRAACANAFPPR